MVYFTALFPYAMLAVLLVRGLTLEGSMDGVRFFFTANFSKILEPKVGALSLVFSCYGTLGTPVQSRVQ